MPLTTIKSSNIKDAEVKNADISPTAGIAESKVAGLDAAQISTNAFNIGVLGFKMAVSEGLTVFNLIDGIVDEFNNESGIDTSENVTSNYDSSSDFYSNLDGPNPIPTPQASLTQITSSGPGTYSVEPTTTVVKVFAVGGGGAGGGSGPGNGGGGGGGAGGVFLDADVPVTGGAGVAVNVGAGGEGHFVPNHPSYPAVGSAHPSRPSEWVTYSPFSAEPGTHSKPGADTTFGPTVLAEGGGGGGHGYQGTSEGASDPAFPGQELVDGLPGGSGGGAGYSEGTIGEGETGESRHPAGDLAQQGFDGGIFYGSGPGYGGGGGGGAGQLGEAASGSEGGEGGNGIQVGPANPQLNWMPAGYGFDTGEYIAGGGAGGEYAPGALNNGGLGGGGDANHFPQASGISEPAVETRGEDGDANSGGGGGSFGGGPGGSTPDKRGGLGGSGQIVVLEMESLATSASSTLVSDTFTANSTPTKARIVLFAEISDDLNTDVSVSATRDNTNYDAITLTDTGYVSGSSGTKVYSGSTTLTGAAPGQPQVQVRWKIVGSNQTAENKIHGVALQWK